MADDVHYLLNDYLNIRYLRVRSSSPSESFILRAPPKLRKVNERAFEPQIIKIGFLNLPDRESRTMDVEKCRYVEEVLERLASAPDGPNVEKLYTSLEIMALDKMHKVCDCYSGITWIKKFPKIYEQLIIFDGLFVVELLRKFHDPKLRKGSDFFFKQNSYLAFIAQDLLLLENQLPFFALDYLFEKTERTGQTFLRDLAREFFSKMMPLQQRDDGGKAGHTEDIKTLTGLAHSLFHPSPEEYTIFVQPSSSDNQLNQLGEINRRLRFICSATRFSEAGIGFKKCNDGNSFLNIKFEGGVMHIPNLIVDHDTERIFRNFIAYEQLNEVPSVFTDYGRLMDCLIKYADDVVVLSDAGIIDNMLGTNEDVANLFNKLNKDVPPTANFYYAKQFQHVDEYYNQNKWKVGLKKNHSNLTWQWILISIVVAAILFLFTGVQTVYTVLSYYQ